MNKGKVMQVKVGTAKASGRAGKESMVLEAVAAAGTGREGGSRPLPPKSTIIY